MTLEEKVGQMFAIGFHGKEFSETSLEHLITIHKIGNFIHFHRNSYRNDSSHTAVQSMQATRRLNMNIAQCAKAQLGHSPFIMVDEEGGAITHVFGDGTQYPGARACTEGATTEETQRLAHSLARQMRAMGFTTNFAPVVDVNSTMHNPVIDVRSYGDTPEVVISYAQAFCKGLQEGGVLPTLKHFPGHGDTSEDSHLTLPQVDHSREVLQKRELAPFVALLHHVPCIMTAHILFPAIESEKLPSTLSKRIIQDFLVQELGFNGLVISDCMEMKAIADNYPNFAVQAVLSGVHIILVSHTHEVQIAAKNSVIQAVRSGEISESVIDSAVEKILFYKKNIGMLPDEKALSKYPEDLVTKISSSAITRVCDDGFFENTSENECLYIDVLPKISRTNLTVHKALSERLPALDTVPLPFEFSDDDIVRVCKVSENKKVILGTYDALLSPLQQRLCKKIYLRAKDLCVIAMKNPHDIEVFDFVKNYLCVHEYTFCSVTALSHYLAAQYKQR